MKKSVAILCALGLFLSLSFPVIAAPADEEIVLYLNGEKTQVAGFYDQEHYCYFIQYVPLMEMLGYQTQFDETDQRVISRRGPEEVSFCLDQPVVTICRDGRTIKREYIKPMYTFDNKTYIESFKLSWMLDLFYQEYQQGGAVMICEKPYLIGKVPEEILDILSHIDGKGTGGGTQGNLKVASGMDFSSLSFGIESQGEIVLESTYKIKERMGSAKGTITFTGIATQANQLIKKYCDWKLQKYLSHLNLTEPITFEVFWDEKGFYIQSELLVPLMVLNQINFNSNYQYGTQYWMNESKDKWYQVFDFSKGTMAWNREQLSAYGLAAQLVAFSVQEFDLDNTVWLLHFLSSCESHDQMPTQQTSADSQFSLQLDNQAFHLLWSKFGYFNQWNNKLANECEFDFELHSEAGQDGGGLTVESGFTIRDFPNQYQIPIGKAKGNFMFEDRWSHQTVQLDPMEPNLIFTYR